MQRAKHQVLRETTREYLETLDKSNPPPLEQIEQELLYQIELQFDLENSVKPKGRKWKIPEALSFPLIADILAALYPICTISCAGKDADKDYDLLAIYQPDGDDAGIYVTHEDTFRKLARKLNYCITGHEFDELMRTLRNIVPQKVRTMDPNLIAVNNGIFDYEKKVLMDFSPDYVFLAKSRVAYNPNAVNVTIHNDADGTDWDVETWISELSDDPEIVQLIWEILGAIVRPYVSWDKSAWFYSTSGSNGKGSLCALMRNLCGPGSCANIPLSDFGKDFMLEPLTRATAIVVDENDVGSYIDRAANLKAIVTHDVIAINIKFQSPIAYQFFGFMVQCLNEFPRIKDKSDSFYRRQLFIPFDKCFTGRERKYIKSDYLTRPDVLEYVLHKVLHMDYYQLSEPAACKEALAEYKDFNDPVRQFAEEMLPLCKWDLLPFGFLYDLYKSWYKRNSPSGSVQGKNTFINDLLSVLPSFSDWICEGKSKQTRSAHRMDWPEPLIAEYNLGEWMNPIYNGLDMDKRCLPLVKDKYTGGLLRVSAPQVANDDDT